MLRGVIAIILTVLVATNVAHGQARDKNIGDVFKRFGQQLNKDLRRGTERLRRPSNQQRLASQTHDAGTCLVYSNVGAETDREPCNRVEECDVTGACVARHIWPSGSETIVQTQNGQLRSINGSSVVAMQMYGRACLRNKATANIFCFVKAEQKPQIAGDTPPAGTKIDPPANVAENFLNDLLSGNSSNRAQNSVAQALPFGTADLPKVGWHYYAGQQKCDEFVRKVHLQLQVFDAQRSAGRLSHQELRVDGTFGKRSPTDHVVREIKAASVGDEIFFASDRREMSGLFTGTAQSEFKGQWLARGLERGNCKPLILKRTENPKHIIERLATALDNKRPTIADAARLGILVMEAPDWHLSTDGEGRPMAGPWTSKRQFATSYSNFWRGFHQAQKDAFNNIDLSNRANYRQHADDISRAIELSEAYSGWDREHVNFAFPLEQRLADARMLLDGKVEPVLIPSMQRACERMLTGGQNGRGLNLEYITGLPFEYWTVQHRDRFVAFARNCAELYSQFGKRYQIIAREVARMDVGRIAAWQDGQWLISQAQSANAKRPGLDALRQTNGFEIAAQELRRRNINRMQYERLYLPRVQFIKQKSMELAGDQMRDHFARQTLSSLSPKNATKACEADVLSGVVRPETFSDPRTDIEKTLLKTCLDIASRWGSRMATEEADTQAERIKALPASYQALRDNDWFAYRQSRSHYFDNQQQQLALNRFEQGIALHRRAAIADGRRQIRNAVQEADLESATYSVLAPLCDVPNQAPADIRDYCVEQRAALTQKVNQFRCNRAVSESGIRDDQYDLRVRYSIGRVGSLASLICDSGINNPNFMFAFKQGGFFVDPNLLIKTRGDVIIANLDLRVSTIRDGRSFGKLLLDIATGENERAVEETYVLEKINYIDSNFRAQRFGNTIGCALRLSEC